MQSLRARQELDRYQRQLEARVIERTQEIASLNTELVAKVRGADSANTAKSVFLATMSHELRTPLNAVVGLTGLLADSPLDRRQRDYADKIQLSAQALRALIDDILDFSKIEARALKLEQAPFSLSAVLRTTAAIVGVSLRNKPIEALFEVAPDTPDALIGDALRLQQVLLNLTSNAIKFTQSGVIVLSVQCLDQSADQVRLQLKVRDTGIGIAPEQLGLIFEGFAQADASTSRMYGGSGLGLAISSRLVHLMGGQIHVASTEGLGSEFCFTVPLAKALKETETANDEQLTNLRILIVDDHTLAREVLTQSCFNFGWQATALGSGAEGLDELRRSSSEGLDYDLLLLDWRMPGMDGLEMLRRAYATPGLGLPLVVLMAPTFELDQAVAASDDLYLDGIAAKPMTPASLFEAVARAYAGEIVGTLPPAGKTDRRLTGMRLLVAEDNELNQEVIEQILTRAGADVVLVINGVAAVAALRNPDQPFDAVLMDIQMPIMDGYTATRIIREDLGLVNLPIIAVTAFARPEDREKTRLAGMVGHIVKPLDVEDLLDIIARKRPNVSNLGPILPRPAAPAFMPSLHLPGLAAEKALQIFGGDGCKYVDLLRKFLVRHGGDLDDARERYLAHDVQGSISLLHGLKGMSSFLQATEIAHLTTATEAALINEDVAAIPILFDKLLAARDVLETSVTQLEALLTETTSS
jgi:signal transduction histidine kinase/CheY-like chemotaxis protein/HPt (histidine-containing phosphotransfer) domain-containing protein